MKNTYHRDGTITYWNVFSQAWERKEARIIGDSVLSSMTARERRRVEIMANPNGFECFIFGSGPYLKGRFPKSKFKTRAEAEMAIARWMDKQDPQAPLAAHKTWVARV